MTGRVTLYDTGDVTKDRRKVVGDGVPVLAKERI